MIRFHSLAETEYGKLVAAFPNIRVASHLRGSFRGSAFTFAENNNQPSHSDPLGEPGEASVMESMMARAMWAWRPTAGSMMFKSLRFLRRRR
jgi:hypothetical protein